MLELPLIALCITEPPSVDMSPHVKGSVDIDSVVNESCQGLDEWSSEIIYIYIYFFDMVSIYCTH